MTEKSNRMATAKMPDISLVASGTDVTSTVAGYEKKQLEAGEILPTTEEATDEAIGHIEEEFTIDSPNSPFAEVRANVPNTDDPELPVNTFRMWFLGIVFTMVGLSVWMMEGGTRADVFFDVVGLRNQPIFLDEVS